ncbi:MAG: hypothetical protein ACP5J4_21605 [Anaerolineae bacterium]
MRQINVLTVVTLVSILGLAACDSRTAPTSVLPTPISIIPSVTPQPTPTQTPTVTPSPSPTEMPTATPTLTPLPTPLPDPLLSGQIGFVAYDVDVEPCEGSPDGNGFYYFNLYTIAPDGSNLRHWGEFTTRNLVLSWSPDGGRVLLHALVEHRPFPGRHGLYLLEAVSAETVVTSTFALEERGLYLGSHRGEVVAWSSDSQEAAVSIFAWDAVSGAVNDDDIYLLEVISRSLRPLIATPAHESILSWSPDRNWLAYVQWEGPEREPQRMRLVVSRIDGSEPREVLCCGVFPTNFHWSADSRQLIFPAFDGESMHLTAVDIEREQPFDVAQLPSSVTRADLLRGPGYSRPFDVAQLLPITPLLYPSPDSSRYVMALEVEGQTDIFVVNADGGGLTNLTRHPANDDSPVWSPDSRHIAFVSNRGGAPWLRQLYVMRADGSDVRLVSDKCVGPFFWWAVPGEEGE